MNVLNSIRSGLREILANKMRSALSALGIIIGVISIITVISTIDGVNSTMMEDIRKSGFTDAVAIWDKRSMERELTARRGVSKGCTYDDALALKRGVPELVGVSPNPKAEVVAQRGNETRRIWIVGVSEDYPSIFGHRMSRGRFITSTDVASYNNVCVLAPFFYREMFHGADAVGAEMRVDRVRLTVVGVIEEVKLAMWGTYSFKKAREYCFVPISVFMKHFAGDRKAGILAKLKHENHESTMRRINAVMLGSHRMTDDFAIYDWNKEMIIRQKEGFLNMISQWKIVSGIVASISFLVGGIGILSVLLISINTRVREIGIRKSIGATDRDIFIQFLAESTIISGVGFLIGIIISAIAIGAMTFFVPFGVMISAVAVLMTVVFSAGVGVISGLYPAIKASRLDPIEALRYQ